MAESTTSEKRLNAAAKRVEALRLRTGGMKFEDIRDALGYRSVSSAHEAVMKGLRDTLQEPADELRTMEAERLDRMLEGLWERAIKGNEWAVDRVLNIMARRARLLGLDVSGSEDMTEHLGSFLAGVQTQAAMQTQDLSE